MKPTSKINNRATELIQWKTFDVKNIVFDSPHDLEIQQGNKTIKCCKIRVGHTNKNGAGEFIFPVPHFGHAFGVEAYQNDHGQATAHSTSVSLIDNNLTAIEKEEQQHFIDQFNVVVERIKDHLISIKKELKKPTLDRAELKNLNPIRPALDENGNPKGDAQYVSFKLMERKIFNKNDPKDMKLSVETQFFLDGEYDESGNPVEVNPLDFLEKKHFKFRGAIKLENIFVGAKISLQLKIYDGVIRHVQSERKRMTQL